MRSKHDPFKQQKIAERMCVRFHRPFTILYLDYRYWQARRCGFPVDIPLVYIWWCGLHWTTRDKLVYLSRDLGRRRARLEKS